MSHLPGDCRHFADRLDEVTLAGVPDHLAVELGEQSVEERHTC